MYPSLNGLSNNLALMMKARERRLTQDMDIHRPHVVGGPLPDSNWDPFFEALDQQASQAADAGYRYHVNTGSIAGLRNVLPR